MHPEQFGPADPPADAVTSKPGGGTRVLLVEDSPTQALRTRHDLESHGFCVTTAENGRKALDVAAQQLPDVIVSDVLMPEVDGFRLCLEARMDRRLRSVPIILRSSQFVESEDRGLARAAGADAYIRKDVSSEELADLVRATIVAAKDDRVFFDPETFRSEYGARLLAKVVQDATELERINERLLENQARLQGLLDNAPVVIMVTNLEGDFVVVNPQFEELVGKDHNEIIGKTFSDLFPAEVAERHQASGEQVLATGLPLRSEERLTSDGDTRSFEVIRFLLTDPEENVQGLCTIATDVSDRIRLERELRDLQKMETVGLLAGGVAHDFGNFLSVISTFATFLEEEIEPGDPRGDDVREIQKAATSAKNLARQLMTLSRTESVVPEVIDLNEAISEMGQLLSIAIGNQVTVEMDLADDLPPITINPGHVEQVLLNLAVNARDAMPSGGTFVIETSVPEMDFLPPGGTADRPSARSVRLRISDTGVGMDEETKERIFDPFYTTKSRKKGTGLGLATVRKVIESADGSVSVTSALGRGTTFDFLLPPAATAEPEGRSDGPDLSGEGQTILVVDDDDHIRGWLEKVLQDFGYRTLVAATAEEARELFRRNEGDTQLVIADVFLPGSSGRDLVKDLKELDPSTKVIFMSGLLEAATPEGLLDEHVAFLAKPIRNHELRDAIAHLLGAKEPRDELG